MGKKHNKMIEYEKIAVKELIELQGKEWVLTHSSDLCSWTEEKTDIVNVVFSLVTKLPSEKEIIENKDPNFMPKGSISFIVDKATKKCKLERNLLDEK